MDSTRVYLLETRSKTPRRFYVGKTPTWRFEIRLKEHCDGGRDAPICTRTWGVKSLIYFEDVPIDPLAQSLEHKWAHDLAFIFENIYLESDDLQNRICNGIERWSINGKLHSNRESSTDISSWNNDRHHKEGWIWDHDRQPPRNLIEQREIWRQRVIKPIKIFYLSCKTALPIQIKLF